ncbi:MAG: FUSC family protein [Solitalea-like symbiont of Acarus siro]
MKSLPNINKHQIAQTLQNEYFSPYLSKALIVSVAYTIPVIFYQIIGKPQLSIYAALTAQLLASAKFKSQYSQRALILLCTLAAVTSLTFIGTLLGKYIVLSIIAMGLVASLGGFARGLGDYGAYIGLSASLLFLFAILPTNDISTAIDRATAVAIGGLLALILTLISWPLYPNKPFYTLLATPWSINAKILQIISQRQSQEITINQAIAQIELQEIDKKSALDDLMPVAYNQPESDVRNKETNKITNLTAKFNTLLTALNSTLENFQYNQNQHSEIFVHINNIIKSLAKICDYISRTLLFNQKSSVNIIELNLASIKNSINVLKIRMPLYNLSFSDNFHIKKILRIIELIIIVLDNIYSLFKDPNTKKNYNLLANVIHNSSFSLNQQLKTLALEFNIKSELFRHALRMCIVTMISVAISYIITIEHGYWIVLTVLVVLQPDYGSTRTRSWQRVLGTLLGAGLGSSLIFIDSSHMLLDIIIAVCVFIFVLFQYKHYTIAVMVLTTQLVALIEANYNRADLFIIVERIIATGIGGILAVLSALLLWPTWKQISFKSQMSKAINATKNYLLEYSLYLLKTSETAVSSSNQRNADILAMNTFDAMRQIQLEPSKKVINLKIAEFIALTNLKLTRIITELTTINIEELTNEEIEAIKNYINIMAESLNNIETAISHQVDYCIWFNSIINIPTLSANTNEIKNINLIKNQLELIATQIISLCYEANKLHEDNNHKKVKLSYQIIETIKNIIDGFIPPKTKHN